MNAFLLAAGLGTRLRPITDTCPKCLVPVCGKPLLAIWIDLLAAHGIQRVLINTHHLADQVETAVAGLAGRSGLAIATVHEPALLGSAGTLLANRDFIPAGADFLIAYADNLTTADLTAMIRAHAGFRDQGALLTMGLFRSPNPEACGIATLDADSRVAAFVEKPTHPPGNLANAGIYAASHGFLDFVAEIREMGHTGPFDLGLHVLPRLTGRMFGFELTGYLKDIGTVSAFLEAQHDWPLANRHRGDG